MSQFPRTANSAVFFAALGLLLLSGCDNDRPVTDSGPPPPEQQASAPAPADLAPPASDPSASDPLLSGSGSANSGGGLSTHDPLLGGSASDTASASGDSSTQSNPFASSDPLQGPVMPTEHSHWLNTETNAAQVSVLLNGMRLSSTQPSGTIDITMKLHPGPNTMTVIYTPQNAHSWGGVTLTEGEHDGGAILLARFQKAPLDDSVTTEGDPDLKPTTQTFTFFAK